MFSKLVMMTMLFNPFSSLDSKDYIIEDDKCTAIYTYNLKQSKGL